MFDGSNHVVDGPSQAQSPPSAEDVRAQLTRLIASPDLDVPARARKFLTYIVEETLAGRAHRIKAYSVGMEVFGRDKNFDAQSDPVVRIEAGRLRRALERYYLVAGQDDRILIEIPKGAYVPHFTRRHVTADLSPDADPSPDTMRAPESASRRSSSRRRWMPWLAAGVAVVASLTGFSWWEGEREAPRSFGRSSQTLPPGTPTLVVMPFADLGEIPEAKIYAAGLTEEILTQLARFKEVAVFGRETSRSIPPGADIARIHREIGARYILEGSVRAAADRMRVTGRLLDTETGTVLWSQAYDDNLRVRDVFTVQDDIAQKVATAVAQPYGIIFRADERRTTSQAPDDLEAYACTVQFYAYRAALSPARHALVRSCLERAVARFPSYATAWAMMSILYLDEDRFGFNAMPAPAVADRAVEAARRAIQLDPENVRALQAMMMALFFKGEPAEALRLGNQAVALNPNDTELLGEFGTRVAQAGDWQRGTALLEQALARNPGHSSFYNGTLALNAYMQRDDARAEMLIRQVSLEKFPLYHFVAAIIYAQRGLKTEATEARIQFLRMRPEFFENWDVEVAKRNFRPEDGARLAESARRAGFPVPATTEAEQSLRSMTAQP
jgi:TolB-like protein/tetratricopeptide (TPR) repeat protein